MEMVESWFIEVKKKKRKRREEREVMKKREKTVQVVPLLCEVVTLRELLFLEVTSRELSPLPRASCSSR